MKKKNVILCSGLISISLLQPTLATAADYVITVKEKGTGAPVEGATVVLVNTEDYDISSATGRVKFSNIEITGKIKIIATGYETREFASDNNQFIFYIEPIQIEDTGLEVTAERNQEKVSKITLSASVLNNTAGNTGDPLKTVAALPGTSQTEEDSADVYMRGSNNNENITWANQTPIGFLYHFGGFSSTIHPSMIEDVNVFLGGFPVQYGDALGGVLDVKLKTPKNDRKHYQLNLSTIESSFFIEGPVSIGGKNNSENRNEDSSANSGDSFAIAGRRSYIDLFMSPEDLNDIIGDDSPDKILVVPNYYDFQAIYHHKLKQGYVDGYFFTAGDEIEIKRGDSTKSDPQRSGELLERRAYQSSGIVWQQRWNNQWNSLTTFAYSENKNTFGGEQDAQSNDIIATIEEKKIHVQPQLNWKNNREHQSQISFGVTASYSWSPIDLNAPRSFTVKNSDFDLSPQKIYQLKTEPEAGEFSPYIKYRQKWTKQLTTQTGLRYTNIGITGGFRAHQLSPRISLEYRISNDTLLTSSWGRYIQMPNKLEVVKSFGNPSLLMAETEHRIVGIQHKVNPLYSVSAEVYQKPMKNLILPLDDKSPPDNFKNKGTGEAYGFDLFFTRKQANGKHGWIALSWAKSSRTNNITGVTRDFSGDQPLTLTTVFGQQLYGNWKYWDVGFKIQAHSGQPYTAVVGRSQLDPNDSDSPWVAEYGKHNAKRLPNYYKMDVRIGRRILFNQFKLKVYLDLQNATFAKNVVAYRYGDNFENIDNPEKVSSYPFFSYIGLEMEF